MVVRGAGRELVEDVVGALGGGDGHDTRALQEVGGDGCARHTACPIEADVCELSEAGGVVIADRFGIPKSLQQRIGFQHLQAGMSFSFYNHCDLSLGRLKQVHPESWGTPPPPPGQDGAPVLLSSETAQGLL